MTDWKELFGDEWDYIVRLGSAMTDPEEKKAFWEVVKQKKLADPDYSIYSDFPKCSDEPVMSENARMAVSYCQKILSILSGKENEELFENNERKTE